MNSETGVIFTTTLKGDLEFSTKILIPLIANEESKQRMCIGQHIKSFVGCSARAIARSDVTHSVTASLTRGDAADCQETQKVWDLFELHIVDPVSYTHLPSPRD